MGGSWIRDFLQIPYFPVFDNRLLSEIWVICQKCQFGRAEKDIHFNSNTFTSFNGTLCHKTNYVVIMRFLSRKAVCWIYALFQAPKKYRISCRYCDICQISWTYRSNPSKKIAQGWSRLLHVIWILFTTNDPDCCILLESLHPLWNKDCWILSGTRCCCILSRKISPGSLKGEDEWNPLKIRLTLAFCHQPCQDISPLWLYENSWSYLSKKILPSIVHLTSWHF